MAAQRPTIMTALKAALVAAVPALSGRVYLQWDDIPDLRESGSMLVVEVLDAAIDDAVIINQWQHRIEVRIGAMIAGPFDYKAAWDTLAMVAAALNGSTLGGTCWRVELTECSDFISVAGDKTMLPHLAATIIYFTAAGGL